MIVGFIWLGSPGPKLADTRSREDVRALSSRMIRTVQHECGVGPRAPGLT
jgi:hypothetical protein